MVEGIRETLSTGLKPNQVTQMRLYYKDMKFILNVRSCINYLYFTVQYVLDGTFN